MASDIRNVKRLSTIGQCLALLGEIDILQDGLQNRFGPELRDEFTWGAAAAKQTPAMMIKLFRESASAHLKYAILCFLSELTTEQVARTDYEYLATRLPGLLEDEDSGVAAAARYLARQWQIQLPEPPTDTKGSTASVTELIKVTPPAKVWLGSFNFEPVRDSSEIAAYTVGCVPFAIGSREVTVNEFLTFLNDPRVIKTLDNERFNYTDRFTPSGDCPQIAVRWHEAVLYCQWLSEREGLPESEWCFPGIWEANWATYSIPQDALRRKGYRLPTEAEWAYAAGQGVQTTYPFGWPATHLTHYAWVQSNSGGRTHPVASRAPNRFGAHDMLGNVKEWCLNPFVAFRRPVDSADLPWEKFFYDPNVELDLDRPVRGGSFDSEASIARTNNRESNPGDTRSFRNGFRVAKTL